jgi:hypothetical protein
LKGLIKLAAAGVKHCEGNAAGVERHLSRGRELLRSVGEPKFCGVDLVELTNQHLEAANETRIVLNFRY